MRCGHGRATENVSEEGRGGRKEGSPRRWRKEEEAIPRFQMRAISIHGGEGGGEKAGLGGRAGGRSEWVADTAGARSNG